MSVGQSEKRDFGGGAEPERWAPVAGAAVDIDPGLAKFVQAGDVGLLQEDYEIPRNELPSVSMPR